MAKVEAACNRCGEIELAPSDIELVVPDRPDASYYMFKCAGCAEVVFRPADAWVMWVWRTYGIAVTVIIGGDGCELLKRFMIQTVKGQG